MFTIGIDSERVMFCLGDRILIKDMLKAKDKGFMSKAMRDVQ